MYSYYLVTVYWHQPAMVSETYPWHLGCWDHIPGGVYIIFSLRFLIVINLIVMEDHLFFLLQSLQILHARAALKLHSCKNLARTLHFKFFSRFLDLFWPNLPGTGTVGKLFPARESLVSDIPAGDGNTAKPFFTVCAIYYITASKK
jgi:hypothetical protein